MTSYEKARLPGMADESSIFAPFVAKDGKLWHPSDISIRTKNLDVWEGYNRVQPMTAINTGVLSTQQIDFQYGSNLSKGYLDEMYTEITITEGNTAAAQFNPYNLFNRVEIVDLKGANYKTIYPDQLFLSQALYRDVDMSYRFNPLDRFNLDYSQIVPTIAQNASYTFILHMPLFMNQFVDTRLLKTPLLIRFFMNNAATVAFTGSSNNLLLTSMNLLTKEIELPSLKYSKDINFKWHNWIRNVQNIALQPNTTYNIKLNTFSGLAKYIFVLLRPTPVSTANNFYNFSLGNQFSSIQLNDAQSNIVGVSVNMNENKYITSKDFNSLFLVQPNTNIVVFNFSLNAQGGAGEFMGGYQFTTNEFVNFTTASTLSAATYELAIWAVNQEMFTITPDGEFIYTK